jgi:hypothetical protein
MMPEPVKSVREVANSFGYLRRIVPLVLHAAEMGRIVHRCLDVNSLDLRFRRAMASPPGCSGVGRWKFVEAEDSQAKMTSSEDC